MNIKPKDQTTNQLRWTTNPNEQQTQTTPNQTQEKTPYHNIKSNPHPIQNTKSIKPRIKPKITTPSQTHTQFTTPSQTDIQSQNSKLIPSHPNTKSTKHTPRWGEEQPLLIVLFLFPFFVEFVQLSSSFCCQWAQVRLHTVTSLFLVGKLWLGNWVWIGVFGCMMGYYLYILYIEQDIERFNLRLVRRILRMIQSFFGSSFSLFGS